ncbi:hypothetical protein FQA47_005743 [Oryzias melastigma]|uniref:Uncharacterized protein n=1 Tax=Oryzias melastigma TaxID=30732 RepID=A0A834L1V6_ORYME|nr:hypothetical protein FQA47_005743 [Oryzias melastigma]
MRARAASACSQRVRMSGRCRERSAWLQPDAVVNPSAGRKEKRGQHKKAGWTGNRQPAERIYPGESVLTRSGTPSSPRADRTVFTLDLASFCINARRRLLLSQSRKDQDQEAQLGRQEELFTFTLEDPRSHSAGVQIYCCGLMPRRACPA